MRTVLITGAAGKIGTALRERLPLSGWAIRPFDREPLDGGVQGDITSPSDLDAAMAGVDAVVHLAGIPTEAPWPAIRAANIDGTFEVFEASRRAGVRRLVYASSNHAVGFTPVTPRLPADTPPRPDTLYGLSKVFGEALGRYYVDRYGMQVACLRIGTFEDTPPDARALSTWLSPDDCARLVDACLRSSELTYAIVWGVSANTRRRWTLDEGHALGYNPQDDAEQFADRVLGGEESPAAGSEGSDDTAGSDGYVGGGFTSPGFGIDEVVARS
ncbi:MAG: uronate dehydrogenase [Pseudonocardiales bacterium]|jgi:uronate dehydrogenase|nr:uronate dehydrogenase [Pseudonocardiales bacterium]